MVRPLHLTVFLIGCCPAYRVGIAEEVEYTDFVRGSELSVPQKAAIRKLWFWFKDSLTLSLTFSEADWGGSKVGYALGSAIGQKPEATYHENFFARAKLKAKTIGFVQVVLDDAHSKIGHLLNLCKSTDAPKGVGKKLLILAEEFMRSKGLKASQLEVKTDFLDGKKEGTRGLEGFYTDLGYSCPDCGYSFALSIAHFHKCLYHDTVGVSNPNLCKDKAVTEPPRREASRGRGSSARGRSSSRGSRSHSKNSVARSRSMSRQSSSRSTSTESFHSARSHDG